MDGLLRAFQIHWRVNSVSLAEAYRLDLQVQESVALVLGKISVVDVKSISEQIIENIRIRKATKYNEIFAQLVLYSFLDRTTNGGAEVFREYPLGNGRVDICVIYEGIKYLLELKIKGVQGIEDSLLQLYTYMDIAKSSIGWLVVFDTDFQKPWEDKISWESTLYENKTINSGLLTFTPIQFTPISLRENYANLPVENRPEMKGLNNNVDDSHAERQAGDNTFGESVP
jgi:hypothetical protein